MPVLFALLVGVLGCSDALGWRLAMVCAGAVCALTGVAYWKLTQDTPEGNFSELRAAGKMPGKQEVSGTFWEACCDARVWSLFCIYGACFGIELTINNIAALYFLDYFSYFQEMDVLKAVKIAGLCAGLFGLMNLFARTLGGYVGDRFGQRWGMSGRVKWLFLTLFGEGLFLMLFSQTQMLLFALPAMLLFSLFVQMSEGATFAVVPFINKRALGSVSGIIGAGGNVGAVAAGFLFKTESIEWPTALLILGAMVIGISFLAFTVRFSPAAETEFRNSLGTEHVGIGEVAAAEILV
jgi:NNP family nitrate/nitrite transporter-like MFS transporter